MALTVTQLSYSSASGSTSRTTTSVTPSANKLQILCIMTYTFFNTSPYVPSGVTGNGLTWTNVASLASHHASSWVRFDVYVATGASPSTGTQTITYSSAPTDSGWLLVEVDGADLSGGASAALVQTGQTASTLVTTRTVNLSALASANNLVLAFASSFSGTATMTATSSYSWVHTEPTYIISTQMTLNGEYLINGSTTVTVTSSVSSDMHVQAMEIKEATAGTTRGMPFGNRSKAFNGGRTFQGALR